MVYNNVSRSLFKADRMMFAMHVVHSMFSKQFKENEWEHFTRTLMGDIKGGGGGEKRGHAPKWIDSERAGDFLMLRSNLPELFQKASLDDDSTWRRWSEANECEKEFPGDKRLTLFQQILVLQALRPDRLQTAMRDFACKILNLKDISPATSNIRVIYERDETTAAEPILFIVSPGSDPSEELRELAETVVGKQCYHEVNYLCFFFFFFSL